MDVNIYPTQLKFAQVHHKRTIINIQNIIFIGPQMKKMKKIWKLHP